MDQIQVRKLDYDGREIFRWQAEILEPGDDSVVLRAPFNVEWVDLGYIVFQRGDVFVEFYYFDKWFNVFQVFAADGTLKGWYCNLSSPAELVGPELRYRDLALDVFVAPSGEWVEDDRDEYDLKRASVYREEDVVAAEAGLAELMVLVRSGALPSRPFPAR